jgi:hypothetical protein
MTLVVVYPSKKELKASRGQTLRFIETSFFGREYDPNGRFVVVNRPHITGVGREFFATVQMVNGKIFEVS